MQVSPGLDIANPVLHWHELMDGAPAELNEFSGQLRQVLDSVADTWVEYLPAIHTEQGPEPGDILKVPGAQPSQADSPVAPSTVPNFPASHSLQACDPFTLLYVPDPQAEHSPPSTPLNPGLHLHMERRELPGLESE